MNRALSALRGAINWERFQDPPLLMNSPFHRFGITIRTKEETKRDRRIGPEASAYVFGGPEGDYQDSFRTAWESLVLRANGHDTTRAKKGARVDRAKLRQIDLHWHDLRHEGDGGAMICGDHPIRVAARARAQSSHQRLVLGGPGATTPGRRA